MGAMRSTGLRTFLGTFFGPRAVVRYRVVKKKRPTKSRTSYVKHKEAARAFVHRKLEEHNQQYGFTWGKVAIRDQRSRWGSCSKKGNLNFSYRVALLPEDLADYVIVHELCHLREFNHSPSFWALVARTIPDHKRRKAALRELSIRHETLRAT